MTGNPPLQTLIAQFAVVQTIGLELRVDLDEWRHATVVIQVNYRLSIQVGHLLNCLYVVALVQAQIVGLQSSRVVLGWVMEIVLRRCHHNVLAIRIITEQVTKDVIISAIEGMSVDIINGEVTQRYGMLKVVNATEDYHVVRI